jgi:small-conductance mechanosensitive channel
MNLKILELLGVILALTVGLYFVVEFSLIKKILIASGYFIYFKDILITIMFLIVGYVVIDFITGIVVYYVKRRIDPAGMQVTKFIVKALLYIVLAFLILGFLGIDPTELTYGGAVIGVIVGLALQSLAPMMLSGTLIHTSKTLMTGDVVILESWVWGVTSPRLYKIKKVGLIFTEVYNSEGHITKIPNTIIINSSISTKCNNKYSFNTTIKNDIGVSDFEKILKKNMGKYFKESKDLPKCIIIQGDKDSFTYKVAFDFSDMLTIEETVNKVLHCFDESYKETAKNLKK